MEERNKKKVRINRYKRSAHFFVRQANENYINALKELRQIIDDKLEKLQYLDFLIHVEIRLNYSLFLENHH